MKFEYDKIQQLLKNNDSYRAASAHAALSRPPRPDPAGKTRNLLSVRSSRKWPIHTRAISLIRAVAWPGVRGGPPIDLFAPRPLLSQEYITFHSLFLLSEEPDITQGQKAERSHPNKTHLSAGRLMLLSAGIKARGQLSSSTTGKASWATGDV